MKPFSKMILLPVIFLAMLASAPSHARIVIDIDSPSGEALPIAITTLKPLEGADVAAFASFKRILERDLRMTGLFRLLDQRSFLESSKAGISLEATDFSLWRKSGADAVVKGGYKRRSTGDYVMEVRLFDVQQRDVIIGKRYYFTEATFADAVHTFADQIILKLTGDAGVFSSTRIACVGTVKGRKEILEMAVDGGDLRQITRHRSITLDPAWSRDGRYLGYTSYFEKNPNLYLLDRRTGDEKKVSFRPGLNFGAAFSPRDDLIAAAISNGEDPEIVVMTYRGQVNRTLTNNFWIDIEPAWSPDGKHLAFVSAESGQPHIYRMDADGSNRKRLTYAGYHNVSPSWSPKGDRIVFSGRDEGLFDIFIMDADGFRIQRLTKTGGNNESPSFSPNGQLIAFSSTRSGRSQIYVMGLDGRGQTQITDGIGSFTEPSWSPYLKP